MQEEVRVWNEENAEFRKDVDARDMWPEDVVWRQGPRRLDTNVVGCAEQIHGENRESSALCRVLREEFHTARAVLETNGKRSRCGTNHQQAPERKSHQAAGFQNNRHMCAIGSPRTKREEPTDLCGTFLGEP